MFHFYYTYSANGNAPFVYFAVLTHYKISALMEHAKYKESLTKIISGSPSILSVHIQMFILSLHLYTSQQYVTVFCNKVILLSLI